jgi:hypothetical protein
MGELVHRGKAPQTLAGLHLSGGYNLGCVTRVRSENRMHVNVALANICK